MGEGAWTENLAGGILSFGERVTWSQLRGPEKRRRQWLLGRLAAKDALRAFLKEHKGLEVVPADVEIATDEYGRPVVSGRVAEALGLRLAVSIAHSDEEVVGIAGDCGDYQGVGIDVECMGRNCQGLERTILCPEERSLLAKLGPLRKEEWLLRLWCIKEAVAKALGRGMLGGPLSLVIKELEVKTGRAIAVLAGALARQLPDYEGEPFTAYSGCEEGLVFSTCLAG
jgi:phosphopantetheine--protein transferase-like protein